MGSTRRGRRLRGRRVRPRRTGAPWLFVGSRLVLAEQGAGADGVHAVVLWFEVGVEAELLLPGDHGEGGGQGVEFGDLDVGAVVVGLVVLEGDESLFPDVCS